MGSFGCRMLLSNMLSKASRHISHVMAKCAFVYYYIFNMATDMSFQIASTVGAVRAMGTHLGRFTAVIELMISQMVFVSGAVPTSVARKT